MMDADVKTKWVAALRSGEFTQGREYLRSPEDTHCCLGVLCAITPESVLDFDYFAQAHPSEMETMIIPAEVQGWSGLTSHNVMERLAGMNDIGGKSFAEIADYIEAFDR
jgi:hypothetical protein